MLDILYALLGGISLVLLPLIFIDYASGEKDKNYLALFLLLTLVGTTGSLYLALSFWVGGIFPIFLVSAIITFYLYKKQRIQPDFVVKANPLDDPSDDLSRRLEEHVKKEDS